MKSKWLFLALKIFVSSFLIFILIKQIGGIDAFSETLKQASLYWCLLGAAAALVNILISGLKVWLLLRAAGERVPLFSFMNLFVYSYCFSLVLPGQTGDAVIAIFLRRHNVPISTSGACYLIDKVMTFSLMLLISAYGCHIFIPSAPGYVFVLAAMILILGGMVTLRSVNYLPETGHVFLTRIREGLIRVNDMAGTVMKERGYIATNILLTVINWGVLASSYYFVFLALHQIVPWPMVGVVPIMSGVVGYIPISISGVGTVEYSAVYLFSLLGVGKAVVLGVYFIQRLTQYFLATSLVALFFIFRVLGLSKSVE